MRPVLVLAAASALTFAAPAAAQELTPNPDIDYAGFLQLTGDVAEHREARLIPWADFIEQARQGDAILLDTRSAAAFEAGHIKGAINLPFSDFTDAKLAKVIGDFDRPIYIYCNNNFTDGIEPVATKRAPLALNIPTYINLYGYGYEQVFEMADQVTIEDLGEDWVSGFVG